MSSEEDDIGRQRVRLLKSLRLRMVSGIMLRQTEGPRGYPPIPRGSVVIARQGACPTPHGSSMNRNRQRLSSS